MGRELLTQFILVGKAVRKWAFAGLNQRWECNIRRDLEEITCELDSNGSELGLVVTSCEYGNEYSGSIRCLQFYRPAKRISVSQGSYSGELSLVIYVHICT